MLQVPPLTTQESPFERQQEIGSSGTSMWAMTSRAMSCRRCWLPAWCSLHGAVPCKVQQQLRNEPRRKSTA